MADRQGATLQELVGDALKDAAELARKEFMLFRTEMSDNVAGLAKGAAMFVAAAVFAVASLMWLTQALVFGLNLWVSLWLAALIVGGLLALVAGVLIVAGKNIISASSLAPKRTVRSIQRDSEILTESTS